MSDPIEQPAAEGFPVNAETSCTFVSPVVESLRIIKIRDISKAGIGLVIHCRLAPGTLLAVTLSNQARSFSKTVLVRVMHVTPLLGNYLIGGAFTAPLTTQDMSFLVH